MFNNYKMSSVRNKHSLKKKKKKKRQKHFWIKNYFWLFYFIFLIHVCLKYDIPTTVESQN